MTEPTETSRVPRCPICKKPASEPFRPFCSRRCADVDLNRWLSGVYAVPVQASDDDDGLAESDRPKRDEPD
jgi:endogenous inhibitor of DNA gyrase (YacG/DUF329 family)